MEVLSWPDSSFCTIRQLKGVVEQMVFNTWSRVLIWLIIIMNASVLCVLKVLKFIVSAFKPIYGPNVIQ